MIVQSLDQKRRSRERGAAAYPCVNARHWPTSGFSCRRAHTLHTAGVMKREQKIPLGEMRASGVRGLGLPRRLQVRPTQSPSVNGRTTCFCPAWSPYSPAKGPPPRRRCQAGFWLRQTTPVAQRGPPSEATWSKALHFWPRQVDIALPGFGGPMKRKARETAPLWVWMAFVLIGIATATYLTAYFAIEVMVTFFRSWAGKNVSEPWFVSIQITRARRATFSGRTHVGPAKTRRGSRGTNLAESLIAKLRGRNPPVQHGKKLCDRELPHPFPRATTPTTPIYCNQPDRGRCWCRHRRGYGLRWPLVVGLDRCFDRSKKCAASFSDLPARVITQDKWLAENIEARDARGKSFRSVGPVWSAGH